MSEHFDAYHKWLAIPPSEQPPNYYRLLGVTLFEADSEVIGAAAVQRINGVQKFQSGPNCALAQRIASEITTAWACLINTEQKQQYDALLASHIGSDADAASPTISIPSSTLEAPLLPEVWNLRNAPTIDVPSLGIGETTLPKSTPPAAIQAYESRWHGRTKRRKRSLPLSLAGYVTSSVAGLALGYAVLCLIDPQYDFLGVGDFLKRATARQVASQAVPVAPKDSPHSEPIAPKKSRSFPRDLRAQAGSGELRRFEGHLGQITSVAFLPDGRSALSASLDGTMRLWDVGTGKEVRSFKGHEGGVHGVAVSRDGRRAVSGSSDRTVRLWDIRTGSEVGKFSGHKKTVYSVAFSTDGRRVLSGSGDETILLWDVNTKQVVRQFEGHKGAVLSVALSPDGRQAVSGSFDGTVGLWDTRTGQGRLFVGHLGAVHSVAFSPQGMQTLSGGADKSIILWDLESGKILRKITGHAGSVRSVRFAADGHRAISGSYDQTVRLWDLETGVELSRFVGHTESAQAVALSSDGQRALSGSYDKTMRLWDATKEIAAPAPRIGSPAENQPPEVTPEETEPDKRARSDKPLEDQSEPETTERLAVPREEAQEDARKLVEEIYKPLYEAAKTRQKKVELAKKLLRDAKETNDDPPGRFMMLRTARDIAAKAADWETGFEVVDQLAADYTLDGLAMKLEVLTKVEANSQKAEEFQSLFNGANVALDEAIKASRYDLAAQFTKLGASAIERSQSKDESQPAAITQNDPVKVAAAYRDVSNTFAALHENKDDPESNLQAGRFLCFFRRNWNAGLPLLKMGADEDLKLSGAKDLERPQSANDQMTIANMWWDLMGKEQHAWRCSQAVSNLMADVPLLPFAAVLSTCMDLIGKEQDLARIAMCNRAAYWYQRALPRLTGLAKAKAETRIKQARRTEERGPGKSEENSAEKTQQETPNRARTAAEVERHAKQCRTAKEAILIYQAFLTDETIPEEIKSAARLRLKYWQDMAAKDHVRLGLKWVSREEAQKAHEKATLLIQEAVGALKSKKGGLAKQKLEEASRVDPNGTLADYFMGLVYALLDRDFQKAKDHFFKCRSRNPDDLCALDNLIVTEVFLKDHQDALNHLREAKTLNSPVASYHLRRINSQINAGRIILPKYHASAYSELLAQQEGSDFTDQGWLYSLPQELVQENYDIGGTETLLEVFGRAAQSNHIDDYACVVCRASGKVPCPARGCIRGSVSVRKAVQVGTNKETGEPIFQYRNFPVECPTCGGEGVVDCPFCSEGRESGL